MEQVFPEQMDTINYDSIQKAVQQIETYVRYMRERIEFSIRNVSKTAVAAGNFSPEFLDRLREFETEVEHMKTNVNTAISRSNEASTRAALAEDNADQALTVADYLLLRMPMESRTQPTSSTAGYIGQILIYNGKVYVCTAATDTSYTWKEV